MDLTQADVFMKQRRMDYNEWEHSQSSSGEGCDQSPKDGKQTSFGHYRRKKTNKAPRKRTFIANMTKMTEIESATLSSVARGVGAGVGAAQTHALGSGTIHNTGNKQDTAPALVAPGLTSSSSQSLARLSSRQFAQLAADAQSKLPLALATLAQKADPVVWGTKQLPSATSDQSVVSQTSQQAGLFVDLLAASLVAPVPAVNRNDGSSGIAASRSTSPSASSGTPHLSNAQDEFAEIAAAAAAAVVAAANGATVPPTVANARADASAAARAVASPKVSFDLFPELAALADVAAPGADLAPLVKTPVQACYSRAVVTGMENSHGIGTHSFSPAALQVTATNSAFSSRMGSGSLPAQVTASTDASARAASGMVPSNSACSSATVAERNGTLAAGALPQPASCASFGSVSQLTGLSTATLLIGQLSSMGSGSAITNTAASAGTVRPKMSRTSVSGSLSLGGRSRGIKRAAAAAVAMATGTGHGGLNGNGAVVSGVNRGSNFTVPLHGVSLAGAVVPGGAGELRVTSLVSVGAYGLVYRGRWGNRDVAVKTMRIPQGGDGLSAADVLRSFRHEADVLGRLAHPNIVSIRHFQDVEPVCIVQDFASHGTLSEYIHVSGLSGNSSTLGLGALQSASDLERAVLRRLARRLALAPDVLIADLEARSVTAAVATHAAGADDARSHANQRLLRRYVVLLCLLRDVASAFVYLAAPPGDSLSPIIHRDVKPTNILLSAQGMALLADFGVAKFVTPSSASATPVVVSSAPNRLSPACSAPTPAAVTNPAAGTDLMNMYTTWSDDLSTWGLNGGNVGDASLAIKRRRIAQDSLGPSAAPWMDALPSADVDLSWLEAMLNGGEEEEEDMVATDSFAADVTVTAVDAVDTMNKVVAGGGEASRSHASSAAMSTLAGAAASGGMPSAGQSNAWPNHHGTAHYAAPEDLCDNGFTLTPAADMFSFGYCLWEALTATRPWAGEKASDVATGVGHRGARLPLPPSWSPRLAALVGRCWSTNPAARPTPAQMVAELDSEIRTALGNGC